MKNKTVRLLEIILYNEDGPDYFDKLCKLEEICIDNGYSYYYITHDSDINDDTGEALKRHTHYLIYTNGSTTTLDHISKESDIPLNKIEKKNYLTSSIKYLVHQSVNSTDKMTYDWHDIMTNDIDRVKKVFENLDENSYIRQFTQYIDSREEVISYRDFIDYVLKENLWSYYRRSASIIKLIIDEHNADLNDKWFNKTKKTIDK